MPRSLSFALTEPQFIDGSKDVTRRLGWLRLKAGDRLRAVRKAMGLKKGEKAHVLGEIEVVSVRREPLSWITGEDVIREGFPAMTPIEFIAFFCKSHAGCSPATEITRIEFRKVET